VHGYIGRFTTYVYVKRDTTLSNLTFYHDDPGKIFINGKEVIYGNSCCSNTNVSLTFKKGWNKVDIYYWENTGDHGAGIVDSNGKTLSQLVDKMQ
jgi:hypothetical protein